MGIVPPIMNGYDNGDIGISQRQITERLRTSAHLRQHRRPGHYNATTNKYRDWRPEVKSGVDRVSAKTPVSVEPVSVECSIFAEPVSADINGKLRKIPFGSPEPVSSLISKHTRAPTSSG